MTNKIQQARRAAFEVALAQKNSQRQGSGFDALRPEEVRNMWWAFNAALDCVVIELPSHTEHTGSGGAIDACRAAIESTALGIKVK